ncbi:hypothetical protein FA09DRAFT_256129 [Tilletiopsis washingtonensis]|uniref:Uncharacterized protein n=1 Tax=Tilletiopsis washingtonensis TaxID=58919 RepID=A0A316ZCU4_9BASI|nr:hypothetical protein FA09DRAFT_256129 [Tilletiopsis washingtonensis]PWN98868.1 hypothetical protein FA09DRAFT_256129 [Tilletiopsis washingtonensis]
MLRARRGALSQHLVPRFDCAGAQKKDAIWTLGAPPDRTGRQSRHGLRVAAEAGCSTRAAGGARTSPRISPHPVDPRGPAKCRGPRPTLAPLVCGNGGRPGSAVQPLLLADAAHAAQRMLGVPREESCLHLSGHGAEKADLRHRAATMQPDSAAQRMRRCGTGEPAACERRNPRLRT